MRPLAPLVVLAVLVPTACLARTPEDRPAQPPAPAGAHFDQSHAALTAILARYVHDGGVDYPALAADLGPLDAYLKTLERVTKQTYAAFTERQKLAFWIDAYNAYTLWLVATNWPVTSIRHIGHFWQSAFEIDFIPLVHLRGGTISLDTIEHGILRKDFHEPRIHFAIVCASKSCPPLRAEAYVASRLDSQLDDQARRFLGDPSKNRYDATSHTLHLSKIFDWFGGDFQPSVKAFVLRYLPKPVARAVAADPKLEIDHLPYDWSVNLERGAKAQTR